MKLPTNKILQRKLRSFYRIVFLVLMVCASFTIINFAQERQYTAETNIYNEEGEVITGGELCSQPVHDYNAYMKRIQIHLPSGESHELRASDEPTLIASSSSTPMDMTGTYYAVDGSKLKYIDDGNGTYRLYLPDGSYYDFAST